jgi:hypothetical protein
MAIQPNISLGVQPVQVQGPLEGFKQTMALKGMLDQQTIMRQQQQLHEQEIEKGKLTTDALKHAQEGRQVFADAMKRFTTADPKGGIQHDWAGARDYVIRYGHPEIAEEMQKNQTALEKEMAEGVLKKLEIRTKGLTAVSQILDPLREDMHKPGADHNALAQTYAQKIQQINDLGLPEGVVPHQLPAQYEPNSVDAAIRNISDSARSYEEQRKNFLLPGEKAEAASKVMKWAGSKIAGVASQNEWDQARADNPDLRGYPEKLEDAKKKAAAEKAFSEKESGDDLTRYLDMKEAAKGAPLTPEEKVAITEKFKTLAPDVRAAESEKLRLQNLYTFGEKQLDDVEKPVRELVTRLANLKDAIEIRSPQADTLLAPEVLSVFAGGTGSGLRMTESEIARVVGGNTVWQRLKNRLNDWQLDPKKGLKIDDAQRDQMRDILKVARDRAAQKMDLIAEGRQGMIDADTDKVLKQTLADTKKKIAGIDLLETETGGKKTAITRKQIQDYADSKSVSYADAERQILGSGKYEIK